MSGGFFRAEDCSAKKYGGSTACQNNPPSVNSLVARSDSDVPCSVASCSYGCTASHSCSCIFPEWPHSNLHSMCAFALTFTLQSRGALHIYGNMSVSGGELVFERCSLKHLVKKAKRKNVYQEEKKLWGRSHGGCRM